MTEPVTHDQQGISALLVPKEGFAKLSPNQVGRSIRFGKASQKAEKIQNAIDVSEINSGLEPSNLAIRTDIAVLNIMNREYSGSYQPGLKDLIAGSYLIEEGL